MGIELKQHILQLAECFQLFIERNGRRIYHDRGNEVGRTCRKPVRFQFSLDTPETFQEFPDLSFKRCTIQVITRKLFNRMAVKSPEYGP